MSNFLMMFSEKREQAILEEIARLGREGHLLIEETEPRYETNDMTLTVKQSLRLTMPKFEKAQEEIKKLEIKIVKEQREHELFRAHVKKELTGLTSELIAERMMQLYEDLARVTIQLEDLQISQNASKE